MNSAVGKWALVTGASSGFGVEFATLLAEQGANLVLAARRSEPMEKAGDRIRRERRVNVVVESIDLSLPGSAAELKARLDRRGIAIDFLVNNAGRGLYGDFIDQPLDVTLDMLRLNMLTVTELTHAFGADMVARGSGHILLVASLLGYSPTPGYAAYAASKAYVLLLGEALHAELEPRGVCVTVVSPGAAATSFGDVAGQRNTLALRTLMMQPRSVARAGIRAMLGGRSSVVAGFLNKLVAFSYRLAPRRVQRTIMQKVVSG